MIDGEKRQSEAVGSVEARYVFVDIVGFSKRTVEAQGALVRALNDLVKTALPAVGLEHGDSNSVICIPTGDGLCTAIIARDKPVDELLDIHLRFALQLLRNLTIYNKNAEDDYRFQIRIGINENTDIAISDINGQRNVAGAGINDAARIMDLGDGNQILVGQNVYNRLEARSAYRGSFVPYKAVVKHGLELSVYQYSPEASPPFLELNKEVPGAIARNASSRRVSELLTTKGLLFEAIRSIIANAERELLMVARHRGWIFPFATSLVMARHRGVRVTFVYYPDSDEDKNRGEVRFAKLIGCCVVERNVADAAPVEGVFSDYSKKSRLRAVTAAERPELACYYGRKPQTRGDTQALEAIVAHIAPPEPDEAQASLEIRVHPPDQAPKWLATVPTYAHCDVQWREIPVRDIRPLAPEVLLYKVEQARTLIALHRKLGVPPFQPMSAVLSNGKFCPILPTVLEDHDGILSVAEGHSRLYSLWTQNEATVWTYVVSGVQKPLQRSRRYWREVRLDDERAKSAFADNPEAKINARDIEHYAHQGLYG